MASQPAHTVRPLGGKLDLGFADREQERRFQAEDFQRWLPFTRLSMGLALLLTSGFGVIDYLMASHDLTALLTIRLGIICPTIIAFLALSFTPGFARVEQAFLCGLMLATGGGILSHIWLLGAPANYLFSFGIDIIIIYCANLTRLRYFYIGAMGLILVLAYQPFAFYLVPMRAPAIVGTEAFFLVSLMVGTFGSYFREFYARQSFINAELLRAEMARSTALLVETDKANRAKSEFIANMSHELRTPLSAIIGFSEIMRNDLHQRLDARKIREYAGDIYESGAHLLRIINNILDLSKIEAGKHVLDESVFDPAEAIAMAQLLVRPRAAEAGLILDVKPPADGAWLSADKLAIEQILVNLLANSVKFTPRGRIELSSGRTEDGFYCFTVCDTGIGMSSADIEVALTPFGMVGSPLNRRHSGTGLGLPIVASLAQLHGGELRVESEVGKGTAISLLLPPERVVNGPASAPEPAYTTFP